MKKTIYIFFYFFWALALSLISPKFIYASNDGGHFTCKVTIDKDGNHFCKTVESTCIKGYGPPPPCSPDHPDTCCSDINLDGSSPYNLMCGDGFTVPCAPLAATPIPTAGPSPVPSPTIANGACENFKDGYFKNIYCNNNSECSSGYHCVLSPDAPPACGSYTPCDCLGQCYDNSNNPVIPPTLDIPPYNVCQSTGTLKDVCEKCMYGVTLTPGSTVPSQPNPKVWTAIGCIDTDPSKFISIILKFGAGIAGGIAFLLILLGGFQVMTASGNPEQMNGGRELIGAAITGLILVIFSVLILKIIGVDILGIPGFK